MNRLRNSLIIVFVCLLVGLSGYVSAQTAKVPAPAAKPAQDAAAAKVPAPAKPADTGVSAPAKPAAAQAAKPGKEAAPKYNVEDFAFSPDDARNPFEPVLLLKAKTSRGVSIKQAAVNKKSKAKPEKIDKVDYELEELRLVGVIRSATGMIAMMEDSQGKGIFFRKGDYLNKNLWVMDVSASGIALGYKAKGELKKIAVDIPTKK